MKQFVVVLGHQPHVSLAELEVRYGAENVAVLDDVAILNVAPDIEVLGGIPKIAEVIDTFEIKALDDAFKHLRNYLDKNVIIAERKLSLGFSFYGFDEDYSQIKSLSKTLLRDIKSQNKKIRIIPNRAPELNAAQVWHNKLLKEPNQEILVAKHDNTLVLARTISVQNIRGYTIRDRSKPARDAKVGMLPPKLAKSMISMANLETDKLILDPFCGSGTVLMEALLDGYSIYGSDLSEDMVEASRANLDWLAHNMKLDYTKVGLEVGDAQEYQWPVDVGAVVSEIYLGPPLHRLPKKDKLNKIRTQVNSILKKTLVNLAQQLKGGTRVVLAIPAWTLPRNRGYLHLGAVDEVASLGYNLVDLKLANSSKLIYHRPNQVVARQLLILEKK